MVAWPDGSTGFDSLSSSREICGQILLIRKYGFGTIVYFCMVSTARACA